jgi:hypothetical protein
LSCAVFVGLAPSRGADAALPRSKPQSIDQKVSCAGAGASATGSGVATASLRDAAGASAE